ncbi:unnamed protein product [Bursaphelenchus xylophilus]|uniref:Palmitoyltransferase n=1 Tax=Bursaphelenchus xylophilus TaxID=6326 RepID=A0A7I8WI86_BURXY|nr:unnamed protein product [Bursaphelenchus xylophilus]CAG9108980.1 unnamed protein product [Bursaphelenchus xylophilus]
MIRNNEYISLTELQERQRIEDRKTKRIIGKVCPFLVYGLLSFVVLNIIFIFLPFESLYKPLWLVIMLCMMTVYFVSSIVFSYYMACNTHPGSPRKRLGTPVCYYCKGYKPSGAHHCNVCETCILNMDHHCVFINSCVGAQNHRYFIQFLGFLSIACLLFVIFTWRTFYYNVVDYLLGSGKRSFCAQEKLFFVSWRDTLCYSNYLVAIPVAIVFLLCLQIFAFAGFLFWQNFSMISFGILYIESLKSDKKSSLQMYLWPFGAPNFTKNWRNFLGLHFGRRFWSHILLPSTHKPFFHEEYTPPMCNL